MIALLVLLTGCGSDHDESSERESAEHSETSEGNEGDEESGTQYAKTDVYDETRSGARLTLRYDADKGGKGDDEHDGEDNEHDG